MAMMISGYETGLLLGKIPSLATVTFPLRHKSKKHTSKPKMVTIDFLQEKGVNQNSS
jgi:hypothetical protein